MLFLHQVPGAESPSAQPYLEMADALGTPIQVRVAGGRGRGGENGELVATWRVLLEQALCSASICRGLSLLLCCRPLDLGLEAICLWCYPITIADIRRIHIPGILVLG